ncbi:prepilin-type N-terminal cleavage/methylation domain-containing protein [Campylobacter sp. RM12327]|uniref:type II secretion system protein n=1 Tax=Campylobacter sputorum TaxID=206 RepID=UPI000B76F96B|nr:MULTISPECIES: prepilin-type N-terminal cleavage/methylation domain-containing protein [Campylobacter]ASM40474.1 putative type II secretion system protein [Campylobacter sputorum]MBE7357251.1 prepilin-type N-terminal cleavage/methylation domain-containing protein [Campylobacter sp. RM11302]MBF6668561.1 prepilin-type N-terminal cleavage/methylation domain-containing protein [Campylobacter sp. RM12327]MBF6674184.1 prepilin-type N-terminal cleavage/methylation domain-containing protein [Campylob
MKKGFSLIELVFVIVILGILAGVAVPRLTATRDDAQIAKLKSDVAAIQSGLALERSTRMMRGDMSWPTRLDQKSDGVDCGSSFCAVTQNAIKGAWSTSDGLNYEFKFNNSTTLNFVYDNNNGTFDCSDEKCKGYLN